MKIVDAYWEKRNLGLDCVEITVEPEDSLAELQTVLRYNQTPYIVVKVPAGNRDIMFKISEWGFVFVESVINVVHDLKNIELSGIYKRLNSSIDYCRMGEDDYDQLYEEIRKGMFATDRISVDPYFSQDVAATRYINWIKDEIAKGTDVFKVCNKNDVIGFFTFKEIEQGVYFPFLAGLYEKYKNSGMGFSVIHKTREEAVLRKAKAISTYISTNNISVVRVHSDLGYAIKGINYIYVKHQ